MTARKKSSTADAASKALAGTHGFSLISDKQLLAFYAGLLECRTLEERAQKPSPWIWASAVACILDLHREDSVVAPAGSPIYAHLKKTPLPLTLKSMAASGSDAALANWNLHFPGAAQPAGLLNAAIAIALKHKIRGDGRIVTAFAPATKQDTDVAEALHFAVRQQLPILFIFASAPKKATKPASQPQLPEFPILPIDGDDVVAAYRVASESITRIRRGNGPTLIECLPVLEADPALRGPIAKMEAYLTRKRLFRAAFKSRIQTAFATRLEKACAIQTEAALAK